MTDLAVAAAGRLAGRAVRGLDGGWTVTVTDPAMAAVTGPTGDRQDLPTVGVVQAVLLEPVDG